MQLLALFLNERQVVGVICQLRAVEPHGMAADVIMQAVAAPEIHFQVRQLGDVTYGRDELAALGLEGVHAEFVVHQQAQPEPEAANSMACCWMSTPNNCSG